MVGMLKQCMTNNMAGVLFNFRRVSASVVRIDGTRRGMLVSLVVAGRKKCHWNPLGSGLRDAQTAGVIAVVGHNDCVVDIGNQRRNTRILIKPHLFVDTVPGQ